MIGLLVRLSFIFLFFFLNSSLFSQENRSGNPNEIVLMHCCSLLFFIFKLNKECQYKISVWNLIGSCICVQIIDLKLKLKLNLICSFRECCVCALCLRQRCLLTDWTHKFLRQWKSEQKIDEQRERAHRKQNTEQNTPQSLQSFAIHREKYIHNGNACEKPFDVYLYVLYRYIYTYVYVCV